MNVGVDTPLTGGCRQVQTRIQGTGCGTPCCEPGMPSQEGTPRGIMKFEDGKPDGSQGHPDGRDRCSGRVIHIFKARRLHVRERPSIDPPEPIAALVAAIPERDRAIIAVAEVRFDFRQGDLDDVVLRKCNYLFEHAYEAFPTPALREEALHCFVDLVRDYGEPEGIPLLIKAQLRYGHNARLREAIADALDRIRENC